MDGVKPDLKLPKSLLQRQKGLIEGAMSNPPNRRQAEHLALLTTDNQLADSQDLLLLIQNELARLLEQDSVDSEQQEELGWCAATTDVILKKLKSTQSDHRQEVYFSILIGYLYGRLTKPSEQQVRDSALEEIRLRINDTERKKSSAKGGKAGRQLDISAFENVWFDWIVSQVKEPKHNFDNRMAKRFNVSLKTIEKERLKLQNELKILQEKMRGNP
jgi:dsDNA-binding SOS-regulon protein